MGCGASSSAPKGEEGKKPTKKQGSPSGLDTFDELEVKAIGVESLDGIFANSQDVCNVLFKINDAFVEAVLASESGKRCEPMERRSVSTNV